MWQTFTLIYQLVYKIYSCARASNSKSLWCKTSFNFFLNMFVWILYKPTHIQLNSIILCGAHVHIYCIYNIHIHSFKYKIIHDFLWYVRIVYLVFYEPIQKIWILIVRALYTIYRKILKQYDCLGICIVYISNKYSSLSMIR